MRDIADVSCVSPSSLLLGRERKYLLNHIYIFVMCVVLYRVLLRAFGVVQWWRCFYTGLVCGCCLVWCDVVMSCSGMQSDTRDSRPLDLVSHMSPESLTRYVKRHRLGRPENLTQMRQRVRNHLTYHYEVRRLLRFSCFVLLMTETDPRNKDS